MKPAFVLTLILGSLSAFGPLSIDMYLPAFTLIAKDLQVETSSVQLSLTSFFIGIALGQLFYGPMADKWGRKKPLYLGLAIYTIASVVCSYTQSIEMLILFRFLQALGSCAGMVIARAVVRDLFTHQETARIFSMLMLVSGIAPIVAPLLGGYIAEFLGWRAIFLTLALFSALCFTSILLFLPETHKADSRVRIRDSLKNYWTIIRHRRFLGYAFAGGAAQAGMFAYITGSSYVFIDIFGVAPKNFGWIFGVNAFGLIVASQVNRALLSTRTYDLILDKIFPVIAGLSFLVLLGGYSGLGVWFVAIPLFLFISSLGMTFPNSTAGAMATQGKAAGSASALLGTLQFTTAAIASSIVSRLHDGTTGPMCATIGFFGMGSFVIYKMVLKRSPS